MGSRFSTQMHGEETETDFSWTGRQETVAMNKKRGMMSEDAARKERERENRLEAFFRLYREMEYVITEVFPLTEYENATAHIMDSI